LIHHTKTKSTYPTERPRRIYQVTFMDSSVSNTRLGYGTLAPGQTVSGDLSFQVPLGDKNFRLYWKPTVLADAIRVPIQ
jgi:hypothetical protein